MATTLTVQTTSRAGISLTGLATAADVTGNNWTTNGSEVFVVTNGGGSPITVTLTFSPTALIDGQTAASRTVSVTNGTTFIIGPFPPQWYRDSGGKMNVTYSGVTSVTVCVVAVGS